MTVTPGESTVRRALGIAIPTFCGVGPHSEEPDSPMMVALTFAAEMVDGLQGVLSEHFAYHSQILSPLTGRELQDRVQAFLEDSDHEYSQIVHVVSHGRIKQSGLYLLGSDGEATCDVERWIKYLQDIEDDDRRPSTLFLIDSCYSGDVARLPWHVPADESARAWVIASSAAAMKSYNGVFSKAVTEVFAGIGTQRIHIYPSGSGYVPFGTLVKLIRERVNKLSPYPQTVTGTWLDGAPEPPFLVNPNRSRDQALTELTQKVDAAVRPFLDAEVGLDPTHFTDRATGRVLATPYLRHPEQGCFSGRLDQLRTIAVWLAAESTTGLHVVTGEAGSGKSALLGIIVCAGHPELRRATENLWQSAEDEIELPEVPGLVAVHLRQRSLSGAARAIARQLGLLESVDLEGMGSKALVAAIGALGRQPVILLDALDEASDQQAIVEQLLLPLARPLEGTGRAAARLIVGARRWPEFQHLFDLAGTDQFIDLERVPLNRLRADLKVYVSDLLGLADEPVSLHVRRTLASAVARKLTTDRPRGGEFLAAALYTNWLLHERSSVLRDTPPKELAGAIPSTFPEILELELRARRDGDDLMRGWSRPVLSLLGHAHGNGMPTEVMLRLLRTLVPGEPDGPSLTNVLSQLGFYLRSGPDINGTTLYRLFHQSLQDHTRDFSDLDLSGLYDRLVADLPTGEHGLPELAMGEPYVARHGLEHAVDAGRLDQVMFTDPEDLKRAFMSTRTTEGRLAASAWQQTHRRGTLATARREGERDLLALNATRRSATRVVEHLAVAPGLAPPTLWPVWSSGGALDSPHRVKLEVPNGTVRAMTCATVGGRQVVVAGGFDGKLRVWDLAHRVASGEPMEGHEGRIHAVSSIDLEGRPTAVTCGEDGTVRLWDLVDRRQSGDPLTGHTADILALAHADTARGPIAVTGGADGTVRVWDLRGRVQVGEPLKAETKFVRAVACATVHGRLTVVSGGSNGRLQMWDLDDLAPVGELDAPDDGEDAIRAITCLTSGGRSLAVVGGAADGAVRIWDLERAAEVGDPLSGHHETVLALDHICLQGRPLAASGSADGTVRLWDFTDVAHGHTSACGFGGPLSGHDGRVPAVAFTSLDDRPVAVSGGDDAAIIAWEVDDTVHDDLPAGHAKAVQAVAHGTNGTLVSGSLDETVRLWDASTGAALGEPLTGHRGEVRAVACTSVAATPVAVSTGEDHTVRVWDLDRQRPRGAPLVDHTGPVLAVACVDSAIAGGAIAVTGDANGMILRWDLAAESAIGRPIQTGLSQVRAVSTATVRGRMVIVTGDDVAVARWDLLTGEPLGGPLREPETWVTAVSCTTMRRGPVALTAGRDNTVRVWDLTTGERIGRPLRGHTDAILSVACARLDGRTLTVTAGADRTVRVWDLGRRVQTAEFALPDAMPSVGISPEGLIVGCFGREIVCLRRLREDDHEHRRTPARPRRARSR
jgi:WD40 repeat protein